MSDLSQATSSHAPSVQPGWMAAAGDPPETERYWDGSAWIGQPRPIAVPITAPAPVTPPTPATREVAIPDGLRTLAIALSILKAIPLIIISALMLVAASLIDQVFPDAGLGEVAVAIVTMVIGVLVVLGSLLVGQILAARKGRPGSLVVWAAVLSLLDVWSIASTVSNGTGITSMIVVAVAAAQIFVLVWSIWILRIPPEPIRTTYGLVVMDSDRPVKTLENLEAELDAAVEAAPSLLNEDGSFNTHGL